MFRISISALLCFACSTYSPHAFLLCVNDFSGALPRPSVGSPSAPRQPPPNRQQQVIPPNVLDA